MPYCSVSNSLFLLKISWQLTNYYKTTAFQTHAGGDPRNRTTLNMTLGLIREFNVIVVIYYNLSKYSPFDWIYFSCRWPQSVELLAYHSLLNNAKLALVAPLKSYRLLNRCPFKSLFSRRNKAKSQGDISGGWFKISAPKWIYIVSRVSPARWAVALSWCRIMLSTESGVFFLKVCTRSRLMTCGKKWQNILANFHEFNSVY